MAICLPMLVLSSCGSDDSLSIPDQTMVSGSRYALPENTTGWVSSNDDIASVSKGYVVANRLGTVVISNNSNNFKVTVTPQYNTYREPLLDWGCSQSAVESYMAGYEKDDNATSSQVIYKGRDKEKTITYNFENGKLSQVIVAVDCSLVSKDEMAGFRGERYLYITSDYNKDFYATIDTNTTIVCMIANDHDNFFYTTTYKQHVTY